MPGVPTLSTSESLIDVVTCRTLFSVTRKRAESTPPELEHLGERIRFQRKRSRLTARALATRAGMTPGTISRLEKGERIAGIEAATVIRLANALGCPVGWLAADEGDPGPVPVFREAGDRRRKPESGKGS